MNDDTEIRPFVITTNSKQRVCDTTNTTCQGKPLKPPAERRNIDYAKAEYSYPVLDERKRSGTV
jgi:hypothetical protein